MMLREFPASERKASDTEAKQGSCASGIRSWNNSSMAGKSNRIIRETGFLMDPVDDIAKIIDTGVICQLSASSACTKEDHHEGRRVRVQKRYERRRIVGVEIVGNPDRRSGRSKHGSVNCFPFVINLHTDLRERSGAITDHRLLSPNLNRLTRRHRREERRQNKCFLHGWVSLLHKLCRVAFRQFLSDLQGVMQAVCSTTVKEVYAHA
jgi:hypothetical protein